MLSLEVPTVHVQSHNPKLASFVAFCPCHHSLALAAILRLHASLPRPTLHAPRLTPHAPRLTPHAPRFPPHASTPHAPRPTLPAHAPRPTPHAPASRSTPHAPRPRPAGSGRAWTLPRWLLPVTDQSGSREALLPPRPLRTGRESFPSSSSSIHERPLRDAAAFVRPSCTWICR